MLKSSLVKMENPSKEANESWRDDGLTRKEQLIKEYEELIDELKKVIDKKTMKKVFKLVEISETLESIYFNS